MNTLDEIFDTLAAAQQRINDADQALLQAEAEHGEAHTALRTAKQALADYATAQVQVRINPTAAAVD